MTSCEGVESGGTARGLPVSEQLFGDPGPSGLPLAEGIYTVGQVGTGRFLGIGGSPRTDFSVVTSEPDSDSEDRLASQAQSHHWRFVPVGLVCTIGQHSSDRWLDAHHHASLDYSAMTRGSSEADDPHWVLRPVTGYLSTYTLQQLATGRYLDAHTTEPADFSAATRPQASDDGNKERQYWRLTSVQGGSHTICQVTTGRYLDAHRQNPHDYSAVTRPRTSADTTSGDGQRWVLRTIGAVYGISHASSGRKLGAYETQVEDFAATADEAGPHDGQLWVGIGCPNGPQKRVTQRVTLQQLSTGRFLDTAPNDTDSGGNGHDSLEAKRNHRVRPYQQWDVSWVGPTSVGF